MTPLFVLFLHHIKQVDSIFAVDLFGNNIIDHRRHQHVIISVTCWAIALRHFFVLTTFRCCLGSNTEQMHGNMKSICWTVNGIWKPAILCKLQTRSSKQTRGSLLKHSLKTQIKSVYKLNVPSGQHFSPVSVALSN